MSTITIDISESDITVKDLLARLASAQEIIITVNHQPVAKLIALNNVAVAEFVATPQRRRGGLTEGIAWISPDFDEPMEDFAEYMP